MIGRAVKLVSVTSLLVLLSPEVSRAQMGAWRALMGSQQPVKEAISGMGMVTVRKKATKLRMYVELMGKGKTLGEALAKLNDRREAALVLLQTMGADKESILCGTPSLSNLQSAQKRQMEQMIRQRLMGSRRKPPKGLQVTRPVTASATLTAEWPLPAATPEKLLLAAEGLKKKAKAADLAGSKDAEKLSPEEQEMAEEMAEMMAGSGEEQVKFGEPHFVYVAHISDQDRDKAMAEAFQKAKAQASRLARAAGIRLGPLTGLSGQGGGDESNEEDMYDRFGGYEQRAYMQQLVVRHAASRQAEAGNEATGSDPASLRFVFYVRTMFAIEKQ